MVYLPKALSAWGTPGFEAVLKDDFAQLDPAVLPLQQGLTQGSHALGKGLSLIIISTKEIPGAIQVKAGIHYRGVIAGCSCADDPTPMDETVEYCEVELDIDRRTAETVVRLLAD